MIVQSDGLITFAYMYVYYILLLVTRLEHFSKTSHIILPTYAYWFIDFSENVPLQKEIFHVL